MILHAALFVVVPHGLGREYSDFEPPLYVALEPVRADDRSETERAEETQEEVQPEEVPQEPPTIDPPREESIASGEIDDTPPPDAAEAESPSQADPSARSDSQAPPDPPPASPPAGPSEAEEAGPVFGAPRDRSVPVDELRSRRATATETGPGATDPVPAATQEAFSAEYEAYVARQREAEEAVAGDADAGADAGEDELPDGIDSEDTWSFQRELTQLIDGIRDAENVVSSTPDGTASDSPEAAAEGPGEADDPGANPWGVSVGAGTRFLRTRPHIDLESVQLPRWFPPELPVTVTFSVASDGTVYGVRVPPDGSSLVPDLDALLVAEVGRWRFDSAPEGSRPVEGSVTIIVETDG
ncbi:MAG: hypothetical protein ACLFR8_06415 [Alkalispirochaeta sp.]